MARASVLVVDGDAVALASARAALRAGGYAVDEAAGGRQALQRMAANLPDVVLTEIFMPEGDGIELITAVRQTHPSVRIVAVTDRRFIGGLDLLDVASRLGADATLDKPLRPESLLATIARLIGLGGAAGA
jgi:CheY-like chemotaxis protein